MGTNSNIHFQSAYVDMVERIWSEWKEHGFRRFKSEDLSLRFLCAGKKLLFGEKKKKSDFAPPSPTRSGWDGENCPGTTCGINIVQNAIRQKVITGDTTTVQWLQ